MNIARPSYTAMRPAPERSRSILKRALLSDPYWTVLFLLLLVTLPLGTHRVYASDEVQYFVYLRSLWFDRDLDFTNEYTTFVTRYPDSLEGFKRTNLDRVTPRGEPIPSLTGLPINFAPIGTAVLWTPFFAVGHGVALLLRASGSSVAADGYSAPYIWAITIGSATYSAAALLLLYGLARRLFTARAAFWATLAIWLGSPVVYYSHGTPAFSHAASFFAVTLFLLVWHATRPMLERRWWQWLLLGLLAGLVTMVREQDGVIPAAIFGAEGALALPALLRAPGWSVLLRVTGNGLLAASGWVVAFSPQLLTYYILNGVPRPSANVAEKVSTWLPLNAFDVMLSPSYGLLFWTPLVTFGLVGLVWLWRRDRALALALICAFLATWYISAVYSTGPARGSFGARRFLSCTPVYLLGLTAFYHMPRGRGWAAVVPILSFVGIWWNLGLIVQFVTGLMDRQQLQLSPILYNQILVVPGRLLDVVYRLIFQRHTFFTN